MDAKKNEAIIVELKDNSKILVFGNEELIEEISKKASPCKIMAVTKSLEEINILKAKCPTVEIVDKDVNDFLNDTEVKDMDIAIFYNILSQIIDFPNRKIYLKVMFKILKRITGETGKIIITEDKNNAKSPGIELLEKIGKKENLKLRILNDTSESYTVVLERNTEEEDPEDY